jgi:hypothetical protein
MAPKFAVGDRVDQSARDRFVETVKPVYRLGKAKRGMLSIWKVMALSDFAMSTPSSFTNISLPFG